MGACISKKNTNDNSSDDIERLKDKEIESFIVAQEEKYESKINDNTSQHKIRGNDLEIGVTLGTGGYGRVRLAKFIGTDNDVSSFAIKMLKKCILLDKKQSDNAIREKNIAKKLNHPFIVRLQSTFQDKQQVYFVMEFIQGGELFKRMQIDKTFIVSTIQFYTSEVVLALIQFHKLQIAQRDLKPENILLDKDGHIKICDFGQAKVIEGKTNTYFGTPEQCAPEVILKQGHNQGVDWWALGILIFEMAAGRCPFHDNEPKELFNKIVEGKIVFPNQFDPAMKDLIKKLCTVNVSKRLGAKNDENIKKHKFFDCIDWNECQERKKTPPWKPTINSDDDTSNFNKYPESENSAAICDLEEHNLLFAGF